MWYIAMLLDPTKTHLMHDFLVREEGSASKYFRAEMAVKKQLGELHASQSSGNVEPAVVDASPSVWDCGGACTNATLGAGNNNCNEYNRFKAIDAHMLPVNADGKFDILDFWPSQKTRLPSLYIIHCLPCICTPAIWS